MSIKTSIAIPESIASIAPIGKRGDMRVYKDNPFIAASRGFSVPVRKGTTLVAGNIQIRDGDDKDISAGVIGKVQTVDSEQFVKFYTANIGAYFELSRPAQKTFLAILCVVQTAQDCAHIFIPYRKAREMYEKHGIAKVPSRATFYQGIADLIKHGFIAAHYDGEGWYWINPAIIFNGDRIRFVNEYRRKRKEDACGIEE